VCGLAQGLVVFAHASGSSRFSPCNRFVVGQTNREGLGTLLMDLLCGEEEHIDEMTGRLRFDIGFHAQRIAGVVSWGKSESFFVICVSLVSAPAAALIAAAGVSAGRIARRPATR